MSDWIFGANTTTGSRTLIESFSFRTGVEVESYEQHTSYQEGEFYCTLILGRCEDTSMIARHTRPLMTGTHQKPPKMKDDMPKCLVGMCMAKQTVTNLSCRSPI